MATATAMATATITVIPTVDLEAAVVARDMVEPLVLQGAVMGMAELGSTTGERGTSRR